MSQSLPIWYVAPEWRETKNCKCLISLKFFFCTDEHRSNKLNIQYKWRAGRGSTKIVNLTTLWASWYANMQMSVAYSQLRISDAQLTGKFSLWASRKKKNRDNSQLYFQHFFLLENNSWFLEKKDDHLSFWYELL